MSKIYEKTDQESLFIFGSCWVFMVLCV